MVDDEAAIRNLLRHLLDREADLEVVAQAADGASGFAAVVAHDADVVVTDLQMPGTDGFELTRRLRADGYRLPVIMVTGSPLPDLEIRAAEAGITTVLDKADGLLGVVAAIREAVLAVAGDQ